MELKKFNSELFLGLLKIQKEKMEKFFGAWNLSEKEKNKIWKDIARIDSLKIAIVTEPWSPERMVTD